MAGVKLQHIPYKGVAPAMTDVIGGQVPMAFASLPSVLQHLKAGRLIAIGVSSPARSRVLPDVPAIGEQVAGYSGTLWVGLFGVRGVSAEIEAKLQDAMRRVLAAPDMQEKLQAQGVELANATPAQFAALLQEDIARWARIVKESGATID
jgi:tripartite-type tricarboxylate transporter receptor subunit TctC